MCIPLSRPATMTQHLLFRSHTERQTRNSLHGLSSHPHLLPPAPSPTHPPRLLRYPRVFLRTLAIEFPTSARPPNSWIPGVPRTNPGLPREACLSEESRIKEGSADLSRQRRCVTTTSCPFLIPPSSTLYERENAHFYNTLASAPLKPFRTPLSDMYDLLYQPASSSKFGIRVCNSVPSYNDLCTCYVTYLLPY